VLLPTVHFIYLGPNTTNYWQWQCNCYISDQYHFSRLTKTTTTVLWPFFREHPGEPEPEENFLDFMVQRKINRGRYTNHPAGDHSIRTKQCPPPSSPSFYRSDGLPATQPTVSKHWRQLAHSDYWEDARVLLSGVTCTISVPHILVA